MESYKKNNLIIGWIVFAIAAIVYTLTTEPTASLWDCSEFIATSYKLEVGHPPGAPLFMMIARLFSMFASPANVGFAVNMMSVMASAFTILFLFWTITHLARKIYGDAQELTKSQTWSVIGAGAIGALAYTFSDTFWFSAVEGEVYALSSLFTAMVVWAILKWEDVADQPHATRWLILIAYLMGLSIGIHLLNLLAIPALVFVYYFKKYPNTTKWGVVAATAVSVVILVAVNNLIIPYSVAMGAFVDRVFVNSFGLPVNSGMVCFVIALFAVLGWAVYYTHVKRKSVVNTILLCVTMIMLGYSSYASVVIRASANPPMNSNNPNNPYALLSLLNRDQYGDRPLLKGPSFASPAIDVVEKSTYYMGEGGTYKKTTSVVGYKFPDGFESFFPRMYSQREHHIAAYKEWSGFVGTPKLYGDEVINVPTLGENVKYFMSYQLNFMYLRYFMWNFVGRQSDTQSTGEITDGNWLSGIKTIDEVHLGPQSNLPTEMATNRGYNRYFFLPFILGLIGLLYQLNRDPKGFTVVLWLFFMMGIALILYFNTSPGEPRERDYVFAGSFYAFAIWIGLGVLWVAQMVGKLFKKECWVSAAVAVAVCSCVPIILAAQNWDDHDRSGRYVTRDVGFNYLSCALPNAIVMNYGDNDTFPLWYNQEVEAVRTDIKVMNMSYLGGDWYIDQMKIRSNESAPVPFSLPKSKYTNCNDQLYIRNMFGDQAQEIGLVVDFVASEDSRTKAELGGGRVVDFLPAKFLALPVNKKNAIESGIVRAEDAHLMVDTVFLEIQKDRIDKSEMMLLDLLANFDWKRPLYFTQVFTIAPLGLRDYLQFDGFAYRLVPIKTPYNSILNIGRIDTEYLYNNLMNKFQYGNLKGKRVYCDSFVQNSMNSAQSHNGFARLAMALVEQGDTVRAVEVLDRCMVELPVSKFRLSYYQFPIIDAYYTAGQPAKANALVREFAKNLEEYVIYYSTFRGIHKDLLGTAKKDKLNLLSELHNIATEYDQTQVAKEIETFFNSPAAAVAK